MNQSKIRLLCLCHSIPICLGEGVKTPPPPFYTLMKCIVYMFTCTCFASIGYLYVNFLSSYLEFTFPKSFFLITLLLCRVKQANQTLSKKGQNWTKEYIIVMNIRLHLVLCKHMHLVL